MRFDSTADVKARNETQICLTTPPLLSRSYFIPTLDKWIKAQPSRGSPGVSGLLLVLGKKKIENTWPYGKRYADITLNSHSKVDVNRRMIYGKNPYGCGSPETLSSELRGVWGSEWGVRLCMGKPAWLIFDSLPGNELHRSVVMLQEASPSASLNKLRVII